MRYSRRQILLAVASAVGLAMCPLQVLSATTPAKPVVADRSTWSKQQIKARDDLEVHFRKRGIARRYREHAFEGLVWSAREGYRDEQLIAKAAEWLNKEHPTGLEFMDWVKILSTLLQAVSVILTLLLLFV